LAFSRPFVFINIAGCTFIFVKRDTGQGTRGRGCELVLFPLVLLPPGMKSSIEFSRSFVLINIAGCTFIF
jgi:hypothetical protein